MSSNNIFGIIVVVAILVILAVLYYVVVHNPKISVQHVVPPEATLMSEENLREPSSKKRTSSKPVSASVEYNDKEEDADGVEHFSNERPKNSSYPKDQLSAEDLLPQDQSSLWASVNPSGQGSLKDRNFLQSAYHIGINTVGQTLRNANLQLRSEPPNPQVKVSPWLQSTIEPDVSRKPFEIGAC